MKRLIELAPVIAGIIALPPQPKAYRLWAATFVFTPNTATHVRLDAGTYASAEVQAVVSIPCGVEFTGAVGTMVSFADGLDHIVGRSGFTQLTGNVDQVTGAATLDEVVGSPIAVMCGLPRFVFPPSFRSEFILSAGNASFSEIRWYIDYVDERIDLS